MSSEGLWEGGRVADGPIPELNDLLERIPLIDHHAHSIRSGTLTETEYAFMLDETDRPDAAALAGLDTQLGYAVRRWCAPFLGMAAHVPAEQFLAGRIVLRNEDVAARLLPAAGLERLIVETGYRGDELVDGETLGRLAAAPVSTVVRLEALAEAVAAGGTGAGDFASAVRDALSSELTRGALGVKSIIAYRHGLDFDPTRPGVRDVERAAGAWFREIETTGRARVSDPVILRSLLWTGVDTGRPVQVHTGFGDPDLDLRRADPILMTDFIRLTEARAPILLLHTYPFQRNAGYLAQMFANVYLDVGLAVNFVGARSPEVIAESLELAPFTKILFSSDAWGLPELHLLGSLLFRRGMARVLGEWVAGGDWSRADAERVVRLVASANARRVYGLAAPA